MIAAGVVSLFLAVAWSPVRVEHDGCPSGAEVELALASMIAPSAPSSAAPPARRDVARLERQSDGLRADGLRADGLRADKLRVQLVDADGVVIAERTLDGGASCAELGRMAAIVIASWESDVHPEFARQPAEITRVERAPAPDRAGAVADAAPVVSVAAYDVAAGVTLGQADTLAAGASLGGAWFPRGAGLGLWLLGAGDRARPIAVGTHEARWRRWTASVEVARRWARGGFAIDAHGGPTVGWLTTEGVDYAQNRSDSTVSLGATAGIRTAWWASRHAALWIDLRGFTFPRRDSVYGAGATVDEASLPGWGAIASVGAALGRAPRSR